MKQILFVFTLFIGLSWQLAAQCVPDTSFNTPGIYPLNGTSTGFQVFMPDGYANISYNEIVQIRTPLDTVIDTLGFTINASIDSLKILNFSGLPASITYICNNSNCNWAGGANGCATFSGTPTLADVGFYDIDIVVLGTVGLGFLGQLQDTIIFQMKMEIFAPQGVDEKNLNNTVSVSPNPMNHSAELNFYATQNTTFEFKLLDITGRIVRSAAGHAQRGDNKIEIYKNELPKGLYFYTLNDGKQTHSGRLVIAD